MLIRLLQPSRPELVNLVSHLVSDHLLRHLANCVDMQMIVSGAFQ